MVVSSLRVRELTLSYLMHALGISSHLLLSLGKEPHVYCHRAQGWRWLQLGQQC